MHLCKCAFEPISTTTALIAAGVASAGAAAGTALQARAASKRSRIEQARAALVEKRETLRTVREAQALRAAAASAGEASGAAESSPLQGGIQGITAQAQSNLSFIQAQGDLNRRVAKADSLSFLGSTIGAGASFLDSAVSVSQTPEGKRVSIFGT